MQTLEQWGEVWINSNLELVEEIANPIYIRHEPTGTIHIKREQYAERLSPCETRIEHLQPSHFLLTGT